MGSMAGPKEKVSDVCYSPAIGFAQLQRIKLFELTNDEMLRYPPFPEANVEYYYSEDSDTLNDVYFSREAWEA